MLSDQMDTLDGHTLEEYLRNLLQHSQWAGFIDDIELNYGAEKNKEGIIW